jgi:hypothetical protein
MQRNKKNKEGRKILCEIQKERKTKKGPWSFKMGPIGSPETSVANYQYKLRKIPEERISHLRRGGSLKSTVTVTINSDQLTLHKGRPSLTCWWERINICFVVKPEDSSPQPQNDIQKKLKWNSVIHKTNSIHRTWSEWDYFVLQKYLSIILVWS